MIRAWLLLVTVADIPVEFGINTALPFIIVVDGNTEIKTGKSVTTARQLQALLDNHPNTAVHLKRSRFEVIPDGNNTGISIRSNRSLVMDDASSIFCVSALPVPLFLPPAESKYGPHLVMLTGSNTGLKGGQILQPTNSTALPATTVGVRIFMARDAKVVGVNLHGTWGNSIRVFNGDGATSPPFDSCPSYFTAGCQAEQLPFAQGLSHSSELALAEVMLKGLVQPPVSLINNTITSTAVGTRAIWITWAFGAVVTRNVIRGPFHYGIDLDAMAR
jgi:hypothetical protein